MKPAVLSSLINLWTVVGSCALAGCLLGVTVISIGWLRPRAPSDIGFTPADLTIIAPPTATVSASASAAVSPTPTPPPNQITIGAYVQISGTGGDGLRIRSAPGLSSETVFRGEEAETFLVKDGPKEADGYTWWYLVAPYDETRAGWAAATYLAIVPPP